MTLSEYYIIDGAPINDQHRAWLTLDYLACVIRDDNVSNICEFVAKQPDLLRWHPDSEVRSDWHYSCSPIDYAIVVGSAGVLRFLLEYEAIKGANDDSDQDPPTGEPATIEYRVRDRLHDACRYGYPEIIRLLPDLSNNPMAELSKRDPRGFASLPASLQGTACPIELRKTQDTNEIVRLLLDYGTSPLDVCYADSREGTTPRAKEEYYENYGIGEPYLQHTLLTLAVPFANSAFVRYLHAQGLDLQAKTYCLVDSGYVG